MKFSSTFISFCSIVALSGCAYIIPPENNTPRNNLVIGEPHRPQLNSTAGAPAPQSQARPAMPAPSMARNEMPDLPPVDAATEAEAQKQMAQAAPVMPVSVNGGRRVPTENGQFQTAGDYPSLMNVPERPPLSGPDSSKERLTAVKAGLEQDRIDAQASRDALARDAAAEPSMLAPQNPPAITAAPLPEPAAPRPIHLTPPTSSNDTQQQAMLSMPQPAGMGTVNFAPPAPLNAAAMPRQMASAAPVMMRPIENPTDSAAAPAPMRFASTGRPNVKKGDFDPLAAADNAPLASPASSTITLHAPTAYASEGYMGASRYAAVRRN